MNNGKTILLPLLILILVLAGCGKSPDPSEPGGEESEPVTVTETEEDGGSAKYENMYFSLELPEDDPLQVTEERSSEYYRVTMEETTGDMLMQIELTARSRDLTADQFYWGELYIAGDQGHLNIIVTKGPASGEERIREILDTMEPCGEFAIRKIE